MGFEMTKDRHSYVAFYPSDWKGGTARMSPMQELVFFRVCMEIWDKALPVREGELAVLLSGVPDWQRVIEELISSDKLHRTPNGIVNIRALSSAEDSYQLWSKKSSGGKSGAKARWKAKRKPRKTNDNAVNGTPIETVNGSSMGLPMHNHNQNHIDRVSKDTLSRVDDFEALWSSWKPYKVPKGSKQSARNEWVRHVTKNGVDPAMVACQAVAYCDECARTDTSTQHVERWIKKHRWEDERMPDTPHAKQSPHDSMREGWAAAAMNFGKEIL